MSPRAEVVISLPNFWKEFALNMVRVLDNRFEETLVCLTGQSERDGVEHYRQNNISGL